MNDTKILKLLECPFCGSDAEMDTQQGYRALSTGKIGSAVAIYCTACDVQISMCREDFPYDDEEIIASVKEQWNRRLGEEALRKIAAHIPPMVYLKAKEDAGYGQTVRALRRGCGS